MTETETKNEISSGQSALNVGLGFIEKPPLGLMPVRNYEFACNQQRMQDIISAMRRYTAANKVTPQEWLDELSGRMGNGF